MNLNLVQPAGRQRPVDRHQCGLARLQSRIGFGAAVRRAMVDHPEDAPRRTVRLLTHDVVDEAVKRRDAGPRLAPPKEASPNRDGRGRTTGPLDGCLRLSRAARNHPTKPCPMIRGNGGTGTPPTAPKRRTGFAHSRGIESGIGRDHAPALTSRIKNRQPPIAPGGVLVDSRRRRCAGRTGRRWRAARPSRRWVA